MSRIFGTLQAVTGNLLKIDFKKIYLSALLGMVCLIALCVVVPSAQAQEFYTVIVGSFRSASNAEKTFETVRDTLAITQIDTLRIELVGGFQTVRIGRFLEKKEALELLPDVRALFDDARVLSAYFKPERILKIINPAMLDLPADDSGQQDDIAKVKNITPVNLKKRNINLINNIHKVDIEVLAANESVVPVIEEDLDDSLPNSDNQVKQKSASLLGGAASGSDSVGKQQEFYTAQVGCFSEIATAGIEYERLIERFLPADLERLRIEFVKGFFTVRIGSFESRQEAESLSVILKKLYPQTAILYAYILPTRIQKEFSQKVDLADLEAEAEEQKSVENDEAAKENEDTLDQKQTSDALSLPLGAPKQQKSLNETTLLDASTTDQHLPDTKDSDEANTSMLDEKPEVQDQVISAQPAPDKADDSSQPPKFSYEVVTVIDKDDRGENIRMPSAIFLDKGRDEIYLINGVDNRIIVYGTDFFPQDSLGQGRGLDSPLGGYVDGDGRLYVTQSGTPSSSARLTILNSAYLPEKEITFDGFPDLGEFIPQKIARAKDGTLYLSGLNAKRVLVMDSAGKFIKWIKISVDKRGDYQFSNGGEPRFTTVIKDVVVDSLGNIIFLSEETSKAYVFSADGIFLFSFGTKGGAEGKMSRPRALAVDEKKRCIYVVDYMRHTVLIFDFTGTFRYELGGRGWGPEWFNYPVDVDIDSQGQVVVADFFNQRVQVFKVFLPVEFPERPASLWKSGEGD